ncbi:MAG TPA: hypothetical protein VFE33_26185 [Thermoanaerobaculia bacterium]|nr:hypothetical protein [Thermoanaerobaculia bacterium]
MRSYYRFFAHQVASAYGRRGRRDRGLVYARRALLSTLVLPVHLLRLSWYCLAVTFGPRRPARGPARCTVVLLSYRRPQNIEWLVRGYLRCDFVTRVIVSNNNPDVDLTRHLRLDDPRIELIQQLVRTRQGMRFSLAAERGDENGYLLSPDDDIFLYPGQIETIFRGLVEEPAVPHGIRGEVRRQVEHLPGYPFDPTVTGEGTVDHLTGYYAFTAEQARRCVEIYGSLGWNDPNAVGNGEDIVLSFTGTGRPRIHEIGGFLQCTSWETMVATWRSHGNFFVERLRLHDHLRETVSRSGRPFPGSPIE